MRVRAELPTGELQRPRSAVVAIAGVVALALITTIRIAFLEREVRDYSASEIIRSLDALWVETLAIGLIAWRRGGSATERCLVLGLFAIALWPLSPVLLLDARFVETTLVKWHLLLGGWLVAFAIGGALAHRRWPDRRVERYGRPPRPVGWRGVAIGVVVLALAAAFYTLDEIHHPWFSTPTVPPFVPRGRIDVTLATLAVETFAVLAALGARFRLTLIVRAELLVVVMIASALGVVGTREPILDSVAIWNAGVALWLGAAIIAIKLARAWRELAQRHRRGF